MRNNKIYIIGFLLIGFVFLGLAGSRLETIHQMRKDFRLEPANPLKDKEVTAELRLPTVALFTFRSLAIDYLWMRAEDLKNKGQYFDALHLSRMICALQPNLASVWDFQAWNMAYNISVSLPTASERWNWVMAGVELIREKGLAYNPNKLKLYHTIAWIFRHKIGGIADDYHRDYKLRLALQITPLVTALNSKVIGDKDDFDAMSNAPKTWDELREIEGMQALIEEIKKTDPKINTDQELLDAFIDVRLRANLFSKEFLQFIQANLGNNLLHQFDVFARAKGFMQRWKMDVGIMAELNHQYGPVDYEDSEMHHCIDWRLPFAHSLYWAYVGMQKAEVQVAVDAEMFESLEAANQKIGIDIMTLFRDFYQSIMGMYHYGNLQIMSYAVRDSFAKREQGQEILSKEAPEDIRMMIFNSQDLRMFPVAFRATENIIDYYYTQTGESPEGMVAGFGNLATAGVESLYLSGHRKLAQEYLLKLKARFPGIPEFEQTLDQFVLASIKEEFDVLTPKKASNYIISMLRDSYYRYAIGDDDLSKARETWAQQMYQLLERDNPIEDDPTKRLTLRSFPEMRFVALMDFLQDPQANDEIKSSLLTRMNNTNPGLVERVIGELNKIRETKDN